MGTAGTLVGLALGAEACPGGTSAQANQGVPLWAGCGRLPGEARQQGGGHGARVGLAVSAKDGQL